MTAWNDERTSRRGILAMAGAGALGLVASALGRPAPAHAADGDALRAGQSKTETHPSVLTNTSTSSNGADRTALTVKTSGAGVALIGISNGMTVGGANAGMGVHGGSPNGVGVAGSSLAGNGVSGTSTDGIGVFGGSESTAGVRGTSVRKAGVYGASGTRQSIPLTMPPNCGVYGWSQTESFGTGYGVFGRNDGAYGVFGSSARGTGIQGFTHDGVAVGATVSSSGTGKALAVGGRVIFSTAGLSTIQNGSKSVVVDPGVDIVATSQVLATLQTSAGGTTTVHRVVRDATVDTFTIFLTALATQDCTVGWFVIG